MARTLYFPDGSRELIFDNPAETLRRIIHDRLGCDCEELFAETLADMRLDRKRLEHIGEQEDQ